MSDCGCSSGASTSASGGTCFYKMLANVVGNLHSSRLVTKLGNISLTAIILTSLNIMWSEGAKTYFSSYFLQALQLFPGLSLFIKPLLLLGGTKNTNQPPLIKRDASTKERERWSASDIRIPVPREGLSSKEVTELLDRVKMIEDFNGKEPATEAVNSSSAYSINSCMKEFSHSPSNDSNSKNRSDLSASGTIQASQLSGQNSLINFENDIVSMAAWMLKAGPEAAGSVTSGGTESVLLAVKTYRDLARKVRPSVTKPNIIASITVHPAFEKAVHYFGVEIIHVPVTSDCRMDMNAVRAAIDSNTILLVGSAPQYCHGVIDPITELSELAIEHGLPLHVDACFGGFMLPWLEELGEKIPPWDFRVDGVTSISADIHKYGYAPKGSSVILYRNAEIRSHQFFTYTNWPGGLFGSPCMTGTRSRGLMAAAWTSMVSLGQNGYLDIASKVLNTTKKLIEGVGKIKGIKVISMPDMTCVAIVSDDANLKINAVAEYMETLGGWSLERQQYPDSLHFSVMPQHAAIIDNLISDLKTSVDAVLANPALNSKGSTAIYGAVSAVPDKDITDQFCIEFFGGLFTGGKSTSLIYNRSNPK